MKRQKVIDLDCVEKTKCDIDWDDVMEEEEEEVVPELEVIGSAQTPPREPIISSDDPAVCVRSLRDRELDEQLKRQRSILVSFSGKLPDNGDKIRTRIGSLEYEKQRRMLRRPKMDAGGCQNLVHSTGSGSPDVYMQASTSSKDTSRQGITGSKDVSQSTFSARFSEKRIMDTQSIKPLDEELQDLGHENWRSKDDRETMTKQRNGWWSLPKSGKSQQSRKNFYYGFDDPNENRKPNEAYVKRISKESSPYLLVDDDEDIIGCGTPREWNSRASQSSSCRKKSDDAVINLDEEEFQPMVVEKAFELPKGLPEEICYPSRDDLNFVQVGLKDLECLSPREYLTSPVINFYIRFLQHEEFSANQTAANCHFFNTFFYKKLREAVSYEGNDKDAFFVKFRRWWKGTDLFRKSYIFVPIHEDLHWSLVIICIPDKEDKSGLTILHLDSLGYHQRRSIVENVKRFLIEEWNYLNQDSPLDLPISGNIWRHLPHSINEAEVQVPQQKNDCDCGLFMLFFIKRFIEEAPQRLKVKDLGMIHRKWFKPSEASAQRITIWDKLIDLFRDCNQTDLTCID